MQTRRDFLKTGALAAACSAFTASAFAAPNPKTKSRARTADAFEADIVVVGAGTAGIPAAIAAARGGAKVLLLEQDSAIGGAAVNMFVSFFCGGPRLGIAGELADALNAGYQIHGKPLPDYQGGMGKLAREQFFLPSCFSRVYSNMVRAEKNIRLVTDAKLLSALVDEKGGRRRIAGVEYLGRDNKPAQALGKIVVDATGFGLVGALAGCPYMYGHDAKSDFNEIYAPDERNEKVMPCTLMFVAQRVRQGTPPLDVLKIRRGSSLEPFYGWVKKDPDYLAEFKKRDAGALLRWGITVSNVDTRDPEQLGAAYQKAIKDSDADTLEFMRQGFSYEAAPKIGVRESRRLVGETVVTLNDLKSGKMPSDVIAIGNYPLDIWGNRSLTEADKKLPMYGIPYRATIVKDMENLYVVGKNMSCTSIAMGAIRVQAILASAAQGVGTAAAMALAAGCGIRDVDIKALQKSLLAQGTLPAKYNPVA